MINVVTFLLAAINPMDTGSIASNSASYDGSVLLLDGEVSLEHNFGKMHAEKAVLTRPQQEEGEEEFPFTTIELAETVHLALTSEAEIDCERASLDFASMQGTLTSPKQVHYVDKIKSVPFELFSPHLDIHMTKNQETYDIESAHAEKGVHLIYNTLYHLTTEALVFDRHHLKSDSGSPCNWSFQNDQVKAEAFDLDLSSNHLFLKKAEGHLSSFSKGEVQFTSDDLDWEHTNNHLVLRGSPKVQESNVGTITSSQKIDLTLQDQKVHTLKTEGPTELISPKGHTLKTEGPLEVDGYKKQVTVHPHTSQLIYQEEELSLTADEAVLHYREDELGLHPEKLELQGHIKLFSQDKRGIADIVTYNPETRSCILKALPGQKVLYMRDLDQFRISANEVHITYNPETKEQEVRGVGHITMVLSPEEQNLLKQVFHHEPSSP